MELFRRLFTAALVAGVLSGTAASVVQQVTTVPLILEAEKYEVVTPPAAPVAAAPAATTAATAPSDHAHHHAAAPVREIGEGVPTTAEEAFQRLWTTVASNLLAGVGYALLIGGVMLLMGERVDARRGLLWGLGGFIAFSLAPSYGLPPELPGMAGADLEARQLWWFAAAICAAGGLLAVSFARNRWLAAAGVLLAALPHLIGAPHAESAAGAVPPELAARFVALSLGTAALFWAVLGAICGTMMSRVVGSDDHDDDDF
ncbi:CbtA family protein [Azospirillum sp.]|uniref:CbtA family protein n=1 Tax=Azospirillum sp. TaxID=34012 RepID=UPI00262F31EC|nr:CbtA family protein [Azospirillum sp.]